VNTSDTNTVAERAAPDSLRPRSLLRRALFGLLALAVGIFGAAWLFHSSIEPTSTARAAAFETSPHKAPGGAGQFAVVRDR
jgi:ferric-dicitrate binding protein FerR (iron transport regulator)